MCYICDVEVRCLEYVFLSVANTRLPGRRTQLRQFIRTALRFHHRNDTPSTLFPTFGGRGTVLDLAIGYLPRLLIEASKYRTVYKEQPKPYMNGLPTDPNPMVLIQPCLIHLRSHTRLPLVSKSLPIATISLY